MKDSLLIIDGLNYLYRAYFGITDAVKTKSGTKVNAVFGFFAFLRKSIQSVKPEYVIIIFDSENAAMSKQKEFEFYKSNRTYEDKGMFAQLSIIKNILALMGLIYLEENYIEADDLIGTYCNFAVENGNSVYISSNDFDFIQLVSDDVSVLRNHKGEQLIFDTSKVKEKYGILPSCYPDYLSLVGDKSDNISGISGIGKKTASNLIEKYISIENLISNKHELNNNIRSKIEGEDDKIRRNKRLISINSAIIDNLVDIKTLRFHETKILTKTTFYINMLDI